MKKALVAVGDLHDGSLMGLCSAHPRQDGGGTHNPSKYQKTLRKFWNHFWDEFVPEQTDGCSEVAVVIDGDSIEGDHHRSVNVWTNDPDTQAADVVELLKPIVKRYPKTKIVRGTEAHDGQSGKAEERIARELGLSKDRDGNYTAYQYWPKVCGVQFQFAHHIGVTSSAAYESSAPMRELVASLIEASQWGQPLPRIVVRGHRHRFIPVSIPSKYGRIECIILPGWQYRTPHVERIDRIRVPHIGGVVFIVEEDTCQVREKIYPAPKPEIVVI